MSAAVDIATRANFHHHDHQSILHDTKDDANVTEATGSHPREFPVERFGQVGVRWILADRIDAFRDPSRQLGRGSPQVALSVS
jgi:hypothetical protein